MASITKLMTAIVALERASLDDVATVSTRTASVGESTINLRPGERVTLRELIQAALIQSANDAANADRRLRRTGLGLPLRRADERPRAAARPDRHSLRQPGRARRAGPLLERPRRHEAGARRDEQAVHPRDRSARRGARPRGRRLHTWNDLLSTFPSLIGVKTGHTNGAGWSEVAAARRGGVTIYATLLGGASREGGTPISPGCSAGASRATGRCGRSTAAGRTARCARRTGRLRCESSPPSRRCA